MPLKKKVTQSIPFFGAAVLIVLTCAMSAALSAQAQTQPKPSPTPRRQLTKPVGGTRGFEMYAGRDASARLIVASSTRNITDQAAPAYNRGQKNFEAGKYHEAVRDFAAAIKLDPKSEEAHYGLARALTKTNKLEEAIAEFKKVLDLNPTDELKIWSYYLTGNAYAELGQYKEAIAAYQQAIKLNPELSKPHNNLGLAYAASNRIADAASEFAEAVKLKADYAEAHYNLGVAYWQLGKKQEAQKEQRNLAKLNPELARKLDALIRK
ncbi:MAG: tetratricopeptide repeat protein [Acidobacteriota bacterium]